MKSNTLSKSLYQAVRKAINSNSASKHATSHVISDIEDSNMIAEAKQHVPASSEGVLHKDVSVSEMHAQKQANAEASVGMLPKAPGAEKGVMKLKKFMDNCSMKKNATKQWSHKDSKGVHTSGGFSGLEEEGRSQAGNEITGRAPKAGNKYLKDMHHERGKQMHRDKLQELKEMPKPNLPKSEKLK